MLREGFILFEICITNLCPICEDSPIGLRVRLVVAIHRTCWMSYFLEKKVSRQLDVSLK
jgi:hypothetical protein